MGRVHLPFPQGVTLVVSVLPDRTPGEQRPPLRPAVLPLGARGTTGFLWSIAPDGVLAGRRATAQGDSVDDDVREHECRPPGGVRPLVEEAAKCRLEADDPGGGSKRGRPMSGYVLPGILVVALVALAGGVLAASMGRSR